MKPKLIEKGCWNCKFGDIPLDQSRTCWRCLIGRSQWKRARTAHKTTNKKEG